MDYSVIMIVTIVVVSLVSIVALFVGGVVPALVVLCIAASIIYLLNYFGKIDISTSNNMINLDFHENAAAPHQKTSSEPHIKEVFHISDNSYTYDEAPAVCAAYGAELASQDQLQEAFSLGAEWCSYGWSAGSRALYPTQESTWSALQQETQETKRTACGRPGINGGYFDPKLKFGVNCYGVKPRNKGEKFPQPLPTEDTKKFDDMVKKFKNMLGSIKLSGFNRNVWSEKGEFKLPTSLSVPI
jgi:hypothetical protein